jgi:hypothetical protein
MMTMRSIGFDYECESCDEITICLREKTAELSDACRTVFAAGMNQLPAVGDGTAVRNRDTR